MKPKTLILMLVAVGCGLAASFMTSRYLAGQTNAPIDEEIPVLIPTKNLAAYARLNDPKLFETKQMKRSEVSKDTVGTFELVKGRIVKTKLEAGKPLAESDLLDLSQAQLTYRLEHGEIAMAVKVTADTAGGGFILPASRVDVMAYVNRGGDNEGPISKVILQNKEVLAVNHEMAVPDGTTNKQVERVVLKLKHSEAEEVAVHADSGMIRLLLRREDDTKIYETPSGRLHTGKSRPVHETVVPSTESPTLSQPITAPDVKPLVEKPVEKTAKPEHVMEIIEGANKRTIVFPDKDKKKDPKEEGKKEDKDGK